MLGSSELMARPFMPLLRAWSERGALDHRLPRAGEGVMPHLERSRAARVSKAQWTSGRIDERLDAPDDARALVVRRSAGARIASLVALASAGPAARRHRRRLDRAAADRDALSSKASSSGAASQRSYHLDRVGLRTQEVSNLVIGDPKRPDLVARFARDPDAAEARRQLRSLSDRRARRPPARPAGPRQGQLGPDRQAAAAAEQQAVRAAQFRARHRRQQHRAGDPVRAGRVGARRATAS